jgi:hypothetical protein
VETLTKKYLEKMMGLELMVEVIILVLVLMMVKEMLVIPKVTETPKEKTIRETKAKVKAMEKAKVKAMEKAKVKAMEKAKVSGPTISSQEIVMYTVLLITILTSPAGVSHSSVKVESELTCMRLGTSFMESINGKYRDTVPAVWTSPRASFRCVKPDR